MAEGAGCRRVHRVPRTREGLVVIELGAARTQLPRERASIKDDPRVLYYLERQSWSGLPGGPGGWITVGEVQLGPPVLQLTEL